MALVSEATPTPDPSPTRPPAWPDEADRYDSPRDRRAREKGLPGDHITGGDDPNIGPALAEDRRLGRWLVIMVVAIVASGFIIGTILTLASSMAER